MQNSNTRRHAAAASPAPVKDAKGESRETDGRFPAMAPYGYKKHRINGVPSLSVVAEEAKNVRYIYERYLAGASAAAIASELEAAGCTARRGRGFGASTVAHILSNPVYAGAVPPHTVNSSPFAASGLHEPIIPATEWLDVQSCINARKRPHSGTGRLSNPFACIMECGVCGRGVIHTIQPNGKAYLRCPTPKCSAMAIEKSVEEAFVESLRSALELLKAEAKERPAPEESIAAFMQKQSAAAAATAEIARQEAAVAAAIAGAPEAGGTLSSSLTRLRLAIASAAASLKEYDARLTELQRADRTNTIARIEALLTDWPILSAPRKNALLRASGIHITYTKHKHTAPSDFTLDIKFTKETC